MSIWIKLLVTYGFILLLMVLASAIFAGRKIEKIFVVIVWVSIVGLLALLSAIGLYALWTL